MARPVLLGCENLSKAFARPLFSGVTMSLAEGDHLGLVGPNGAGKSTFLKILAGLETPDSGSRTLRRDARVGYVPQDPVFAPGRTVSEVVRAALAEHPGYRLLGEDEADGKVRHALSLAGFYDLTLLTDALSGGWRKRLAITCTLVGEPDALLLDEPTNHLDVDSILWLEELLDNEPRAFIVVSHDRYFLDNVATRMVELNPTYAGGCLAVAGGYSDFLEERDAVLRNQATYQDVLANLVRREVEWLRRGPKARTTKAKGRIKSAEQKIDDLAEVRSRTSTQSTGLDFTATARRTKKLWACTGLTKSLGGRLLLGGLDVVLGPGMRLGVLGANGSGKTTFLRLLIGDLQPDGGSIEQADALRVVYFEQNRSSLDPTETLRRALSPDGDTLFFRDKSLHVASYARRFLFRGEQLDMPVGKLSGGEQARLVLARLMLEPADLMVLDEPTNDLDIATLDVLEEALLDFPGAIVLVTHDRFLLERVSTDILVFDGEGGTERFADYRQWEASRASRAAGRKGKAADKGGGSTEERVDAAAPTTASAGKSKRLSYLEQREWDQMEEKVLAAEAALAAAQRAVEDPSVASNGSVLQERLMALSAAQLHTDSLYARWAELENKRGG